MTDTTEPTLTEDASDDAVVEQENYAEADAQTELDTDTGSAEAEQGSGDEEETTQYTDPRMAILEKRAQAQYADLEEQESEETEAETETEAIAETDEQEDEELQGEEAAHEHASLPEDLIRKDDGEYYVSMNVGGETVEVPYSKVKEAHNKMTYADQRMREAAWKEQQLQQREQQLNQTQSLPVQDATVTTAQAEPVQSQKQIDELWRSMKDSAMLDDEDAEARGKQLLADMLTANQQPQADPTQLIQQTVDQAIAEKSQQDHLEAMRISALDAVESDPLYKNLFADDALRAEIGSYSNAFMHAEPQLSIEENLRKSAEIVRNAEIAKGNSAVIQSTNNDDLSARRDAKRNLAKNQVQASHTRARVAQPAEKQKTSKEVINDMRKARGLSR